MKDESWLVVDTETNGLFHPVFVLEIAAQRMVGWEPDGEPFRVLLNHDVPIDPGAEAVHGYSREFLRQAGMDPHEAHGRFREYAGDRPIVAYNLSFDWDRVLLPECQRMRIPTAGCKGFCAMALARRVIHETGNYRLQTVKQHFRLTEGRAHRGLNDVLTVVELFKGVFRERLEPSGLVGFDAIAAFSRRTPVARCRASLRCCGAAEPAEVEVVPRPRVPRAAVPLVRPMSVTAVKAAIRNVLLVCRQVEQEGVDGKAMKSLRRRLDACPYPSIYPMCALRDALRLNDPALLLGVIQDALAAYEDSQA
jgi:DNA polymerase-3 subunit epsilon